MHGKKVRNIILVSLILIIAVFTGFNFYSKINSADAKDNKQIDDKVLVTNELVNNNETVKDELEGKETGFRDNLSRFDTQGNVQINATLENPIEDNEQYIVIKVQLSTHSVNLDVYDFSKIVSFKTSEGIELSKEILWEKTEGGGHHYLGVYKIPKKINGRSIITENTESIELNILNLDNVLNRSFKWDKDILKLIN